MGYVTGFVSSRKKLYWNFNSKYWDNKCDGQFCKTGNKIEWNEIKLNLFKWNKMKNKWYIKWKYD